MLSKISKVHYCKSYQKLTHSQSRSHPSLIICTHQNHLILVVMTHLTSLTKTKTFFFSAALRKYSFVSAKLFFKKFTFYLAHKQCCDKTKNAAEMVQNVLAESLIWLKRKHHICDN